MKIDIKNLSKAFSWEGGRQEVLKNCDVHIDSGSFVSIMGASGSGKSTLLNIIGAMLSPDSGEVFVGDFALHEFSSEEQRCYRRDHLGFVFQKAHLLPELSIAENILLPHELMGLSPHALRAKLDDLVEELAIEKLLDKMPWMLSGGEQQRVAIARALIGNVSIILADEPTGNLDEAQSKIVQDLLIRSAKEHGATLVVVTHDAEFASRGEYRYKLTSGVLEALSC